jgi:hypothetical protein
VRELGPAGDGARLYGEYRNARRQHGLSASSELFFFFF